MFYISNICIHILRATFTIWYLHLYIWYRNLYLLPIRSQKYHLSKFRALMPGKKFFDLSANAAKRKRTDLCDGSLPCLTTSSQLWFHVFMNWLLFFRPCHMHKNHGVLFVVTVVFCFSWLHLLCWGPKTNKGWCWDGSNFMLWIFQHGGLVPGRLKLILSWIR